MTNRLIVTGASGFVAGNVIRQAGPQWEVHAVSGKPAPIQRDGLTWHTFDLLDFDRLQRMFHEVKPAALIHAAAIADIDHCQQHPNEAERVNVELTRELARLCRETEARMVHLSTDTVFNGQKGNYIESDVPEPVNHYGVTKAAAERIVLEIADNSIVARLALVMGFPVFGTGHTFLPRMIEALRSGHEFGVPDDEIRTPIDVVTLGAALLELAGNDLQGHIHLSGDDTLKRFDMAQRIAERLWIPRALIIVKNACDTPGRAPRPRDVSLNNRKARKTLRTPMCGLDAALTIIIDDHKEPSS